MQIRAQFVYYTAYSFSQLRFAQFSHYLGYETWKTTWGLYADILERIEIPSIKTT